MRPMTRLALVALLVARCGGGAGTKTLQAPGGGSGSGDVVSDPIPTTAAPECAAVAERLATVAHADTPDRQGEARDMLRTRCVDDKWSDEARSCFATVENDGEVQGCASKLTDTQQKALHVERAAPVEEPVKKSTRSGTRGPKPRDSSDPCEGGE